MQGVWGSNNRQVISVIGVMAMAIGHISAQHLQDEADEVDNNADDVVGDVETEAEEDEDRMGGWPCWYRRNQQLQVRCCNQHL